MPNGQAEFRLAAREDGDNEQDREARLLARVHRALVLTIDEEITRAKVCYVLHVTEQQLSKELSCSENKEPKARTLAFALKHAKTDRLSGAVAEYADLLPFQRPAAIDPEQAMRDVVALALAGEFSNAGREKVMALYARMKGGAR